MRITTGLDLVEIQRMARSMENPRFLLRVFSEAERDLLAQRSAPIARTATAAANFAAKEAFSKAMGTGLAGFSLSEVSTLRDGRGAPYLVLTGRAAELAAGAQLAVSLTHTDGVAGAVVTALWQTENEKQEDGPCMQ